MPRTKWCHLLRPTSSRESSQGQSLVELAIFLPVLLLIMLMTVDLGRVYLGWVSLNNVARIGANYAAVNPDGWQGSGNAATQATYRRLMGNDTAGIDCTLPGTLPNPTFPDAAPNTYLVGSRVTVNLSCSFRLLTPLLSNLIGDGAGNLPVTAGTTFIIRTSWAGTGAIGGNNPTPSRSPTPPPTPSPSATAAPTPIPSGPTPAPTITPVPPTVKFYGSPNGVDSYGGGSDPTDPDYNQVVGIPGLLVTFYNTTAGTPGNCLWVFGDGGTSNACSNQVSHTYSGNTRTAYNVSLTVDGGSLTRSSYVLISCKVPSFANVHISHARTQWQTSGFTGANFSPTTAT